MSRAAFKLMELDDRYRLFNRAGMTTVDLGFAPGSWSQVAVERSQPRGRVVGVDILPHRPPPGASAIQGNFLSKAVQEELKQMLRNPELGRRAVKKNVFADELEASGEVVDPTSAAATATTEAVDSEQPSTSYIDMEKKVSSLEDQHPHSKYPVDLVLSDMCEPWPQLSGFWLRTINDPYIRMANTTGNSFRDHGLSIVSSPSWSV